MSEIWSEERCRKWLQKDVVSGDNTLEQFRSRLINWHLKQYAEAGNPERLDWADQSLMQMTKCIQDMNLEEPKRRSLFEQFKQ